MILKGSEKEENVKDLDIIIANCGCGCDESIHIKRYIYEGAKEPIYNMSIQCGKFNAKQKGVFRIIAGRLKNAWVALTGKDYLLCDVIIKPSDINKLIENLKEIVK